MCERQTANAFANAFAFVASLLTAGSIVDDRAAAQRPRNMRDRFSAAPTYLPRWRTCFAELRADNHIKTKTKKSIDHTHAEPAMKSIEDQEED